MGRVCAKRAPGRRAGLKGIVNGSDIMCWIVPLLGMLWISLGAMERSSRVYRYSIIFAIGRRWAVSVGMGLAMSC